MRTLWAIGLLGLALVVESNGQAPEGWTCTANFYNNGICDCGTCGVFEDDCRNPKSTQTNCKPDEKCDASLNKCVRVDPEPGNPPENWSCKKEKFFDGSVCDCNCGYRDPDCDGDYSGFICHGQENYAELNACDENFSCIEEAWAPWVWYVLIGVPVGLLLCRCVVWVIVVEMKSRKDGGASQKRERPQRQTQEETIRGLPKPSGGCMDSCLSCFGQDDDVDYIVPRQTAKVRGAAAQVDQAPPPQVETHRPNRVFRNSIEV